MGTAVDPTYPLYPVACILASMGLLFVLLTSFARHNWNLGVTFLCFWLLLEIVTNAVNAIVWSDNTEIKYLVYCDIVSRVQTMTAIVKPMATLIIIRRLYIISSLQWSVEITNAAARRRNLFTEWTLGLIIPMLITGPIYYIVQYGRFEVIEGAGCENSVLVSVCELLLIKTWSIIPPILSLVFYYPKVALTFHRQSKDIDGIMRSDNSVSRTNYLRILVLASVDILVTLPFGIANLVLAITSNNQGPLPFYQGWTAVHANIKEPITFSYAEVEAGGASVVARQYFSYWSSPILAFTIFGLFGVTAEARASYWNIICTIGGWFGWKPTPNAPHASSQLGTMEFGAQPQETITFDAEMGSHLSFIDTTLIPATRTAEEQGVVEDSSGCGVSGGDALDDAEASQAKPVVPACPSQTAHSLSEHTPRE